MGLHQTKKLLNSKGNHQQNEKAEQEKIFVNHISAKELISKNIKDSCNSIANKHNLIKEWAEDLNRHFSREDIQMANG